MTLRSSRWLPVGTVAGLALAAALLLAISASQAADKNAKGADEKGFVDLLPGGKLDHWHTKGNWSIDDDGVITLTPREGEKGWARFDAYLWSMKEYKDFEIEFDYMVQDKGNSGFYLHVGDKASPVQKGIEVQIYDSYPKGADGKLTDHDSGGIIPGIPPQKNAAKPAGEWNHFNVVCQGNEIGRAHV